MTGIAKFYNKFLSFIELDPTRPTHICKFSDQARPDPTRGSTRPACNSGHRSQFITLTVEICVQHGGREALRRAGLSAAADTCFT